MAILYKLDGSKQFVSKEQGIKIWRGLHEPDNLDQQQLEYLGTIKRLFLNWRDAPEDYIEANLSSIIPLALNEWRVDKHGRPLKPATEFAWKFSKRWGLWNQGQPTVLVTNPTAITQTSLSRRLEVHDR